MSKPMQIEMQIHMQIHMHMYPYDKYPATRNTTRPQNNFSLLLNYNTNLGLLIN